MIARKLHLPFSALLDGARSLHDATTDADYASALAYRLHAGADTPADNFTTRFNQKLTARATGDSTQKQKTVTTGTLTESQKDDFQEMERLPAGARRSARLALAGDKVKRHTEFQVAINEPNTLDAELERAKMIPASWRLPANAPVSKAQGWLAKDSDVLVAAIEQRSGKSMARDESFDERLGLDQEKIAAANAVYADAIRIQNAARLEYPANKTGNETARACFLLDEFPPRDRSEPSGGTQRQPLQVRRFLVLVTPQF